MAEIECQIDIHCQTLSKRFKQFANLFRDRLLNTERGGGMEEKKGDAHKLHQSS